jgi:uncharacterized cupredoxin-like copper-binding protein
MAWVFNLLEVGTRRRLKMWKRFLHCTALALCMAAIGGCGTPGKNLAPKAGIAMNASADTLRAEIVLRNFYFDPNRIVTEVGRPLQLTLKKRSGFLGLIPHDFNLIAPDANLNVVKQKVPGGDGVTITIQPTRVGEYKFFCGKDRHAEKGMVGDLIVKTHDSWQRCLEDL